MTKSVQLFLLRHGIAVDHGTPGYSDSERPLTDEGIAQMRQIGKGMKALGLDFDLILSSPFLRTRQTAEIVAKALDFEKKLKFSDALQSGMDSRGFGKELQKHSAAGRILLVGHEPAFSQFVSILISGRKDCSIQFKKGGLCKLEVHSLESSSPSGVLKWLLTPKQLCAFAKS